MKEMQDPGVKCGKLLDESKLLLQVETVSRTFHETALHVAAEHDDYIMAELLLEANRGCANSLMDETLRLTPLHIVSENGYLNTTKVLLKYGADVSLVTGKNMTALHLAANNLNLGVLKLLLEVTVKTDTNLINARDDQGRTPLFVCSSSQLKSSQGAIDCMISLINLKADLDAQNDVGNTPLHNAAIGDQNDIINQFLNSPLCRQKAESCQIADQFWCGPEHQE